MRRKAALDDYAQQHACTRMPIPGRHRQRKARRPGDSVRRSSNLLAVGQHQAKLMLVNA